MISPSRFDSSSIQTISDRSFSQKEITARDLEIEYPNIFEQIQLSGSVFLPAGEQLSPLEKAFINKDIRLLQLLLGHMGNETFKLAANIETSMSQCHCVLSSLAIEASKHSIVHKLVLSGDLETLGHFLGKNRFINDLCPKYKLSCMHFAALSSQPEMIDLLIDNGFDIDAQDLWGRTALHYGVLNPNKAILNSLLTHGANLRIFDIYGCTPIDYMHFDALSKDPLFIPHEEINETKQLAFAIACQKIAQLNYFSQWSTLTSIANYFVPICIWHILIKKETTTTKIAALLLVFLSQQMTVPKFILNTFFISHLTLRAFTRLKHCFFQLPQRRSASLKTALKTILPPFLFSAHCISEFPLNNISNHIFEFATIKQMSDHSLFKTTQREWKRLKVYGSICVNQLHQFFS